MQKMIMVTIILVILWAIPLSAQITIPTNPYNPPVGTLMRSSSEDISESFYNGVTSGSGGGHLWDFSSILFSDEDTSFIVDCSTTPSSGNFPTANLCWNAETDSGSVWSYSSSLPGSFLVLGMFASIQGAGDFLTIYENTAPDYVFPIAMNNSWISHRHWTMDVGGGIVINNSDSTFYNVEAWGQYKYDNRIVDCLRIKSTERVWVATIINGMPMSTNVTEIERYDYVSSDYFDALTVTKVNTALGSPIYNVAANLNSLDQHTLVIDYDESILPEGFALGQNYPNPFNPATSIDYDLPHSATVNLEIINVVGQLVKSFDLGNQPAGSHSIKINLFEDISAQLPSGVYFYKLSAGEFSDTRKMMLLK